MKRKETPTVTFTPRTDADVDNSRYEAKVAREETDDYGNTATMYRKVEIKPDGLQAERDSLVARIADIDELLGEVGKLGIGSEAGPALK